MQASRQASRQTGKRVYKIAKALAMAKEAKAESRSHLPLLVLALIPLIIALPGEVTGSVTSQSILAWAQVLLWAYVGTGGVPQWLLTTSSPMDANEKAIATMDILFSVVITAFGLVLPSPHTDGDLVMVNAMIIFMLVYFLLSLTLYMAWGKLQVPL
jgi:uncharacterized membrane protein